MTEEYDSGEVIYYWIRDLFPICRSLSGPGVLETIAYMQNLLPDLAIHEVRSGTRVFDWVVPDEWTLRRAYITCPDGTVIADTDICNLHVVNYSEPVAATLSRSELDQHLYSLPEQPDAIPYVTSYYKRRWGFCLQDSLRQSLPEGDYKVVIDSELKPGKLHYADLLLPGKTSHEIMISTYICHPSMANNELSGPTVTMALARWLARLPDRHYSYRFVFVPETIGALTYLSRNLEHLKAHVAAGFVMTCVGDDRTYSFMPSRKGGTLADQAALHAIRHLIPECEKYSWYDRGSDERQYCAPGVDLPFVSIMRSKYGTYPEYHTSLDNLDLVSPHGLAGSFHVMRKVITALEKNILPQITVLGEPQLGRHDLYPSVSKTPLDDDLRIMLTLLSLSDGTMTLLDIADTLEKPIWDLLPMVDTLLEKGLIRALPAQITDSGDAT